jgi:hypothetical protein
MLLNNGNCFAMGVTVLTVPSGSFVPILPIKNQIGVALWTGSTGIELAGGGASYAPSTSSFTLIGGVTYGINFMNSNGSSLQLATNGNGLPIYNTILAPMTIMGGGPFWVSAAVSTTLRVAYLGNDPFIQT